MPIMPANACAPSRAPAHGSAPPEYAIDDSTGDPDDSAAVERYYRGERTVPGLGTTSPVIVQRVLLDAGGRPRVSALFHRGRHSPDGFNWGYCGSGPADLAFSILADMYGGHGAVAHVLYQEFKREVVAMLPADSWRLDDRTIEAWVRIKHRTAAERLRAYDETGDEPDKVKGGDDA